MTKPRASRPTPSMGLPRAILLLIATLCAPCISVATDTTVSPLSIEAVQDVTIPLLDPQQRAPVTLTLEEAIQRALAANLDIRVGAFNPRIQMQDVVRAEAAFDAVFFGSTNLTFQDRAAVDARFYDRTVITPGGTTTVQVPVGPFDQTHTYDYNLGLRRRLPTGAVLELAETLRRYRDLNDPDNEYLNNPFYEFALGFQLSQPLLRDFGIDVNRAAINAARNNYRISQQNFNILVIETVSEVEVNYWRLVFTRQRLKIFQGLFTEADNTLQRLLARRPQDTNTEILAQTRSLMERARAGIVSARNSIEDQQSRLLESLNDPELPLEKDWEVIPADPPTLTLCEIDPAAARAAALQHRPEIAIQRLRIDTAGLALGVAENQVLPRLDLILQTEFTGPGGVEHESWDAHLTNDNVDYGIGLSFEVPVGNRAALAQRLRRQSEQRQEEARLTSVRDQVLADVRIATDTLVHSYEEIQSRLDAARAEQDALASLQAQKDAEAAATPAFLDRMIRAKERVATALINLVQVVNRYNLALLDVQRAQGTLLRYNNIKLAELTPDEPAVQ